MLGILIDARHAEPNAQQNLHIPTSNAVVRGLSAQQGLQKLAEIWQHSEGLELQLSRAE